MNKKQYLKNLTIPKGKIDVVVDTAIAVGYYMECDEQFAIGYMLGYDKFNIKAFYLELANDETMRVNRRKGVTDLLDCFGRQDLYPYVIDGGTRRLQPDNPEKSGPVMDLISRAKNYSPENPLYVFAIGPLTNVGTALKVEPSIAEKIVVLWVGGHSFDYKDTDEYNLKCDVAATNVVLESDVPLILVPCMGVSSKLAVSTKECVEVLSGKSKIGDYIIDYLHKMAPIEENFNKMVRIIWDGVGPAMFLQEDQELVSYEICERPLVSEDKHWVFSGWDKKILYAKDIDPEKIKAHMLSSLSEK